MEGFEWDDAKDTSNQAKHGIPFRVAAALFEDPRHRLRDASRPEDNERRRAAIGPLGDQMIYVVFTVRANGVQRLISARRASRSERSWYQAVQDEQN